jgi:predicted phosphoribosyltransferase
MLAKHVQQYHRKNAIILCLQESSLLTCLTMAKQLHAWVYPLIYAPIYTPNHAHQLLGAYDQDGKFIPLPGGSTSDSNVSEEMEKVIAGQHAEAMKSNKSQASKYGITLDKHRMDGRDIILVGDVVTNKLPLLAAQQLLKSVSPKSVTAMVGNATPDAAQLVRISAGKTEILDILSGVFYSEDHYFEHADKYTPEQKRAITQNIAAYWQ